MKDSRNPFRLQTAESIETDADFLNLFGPGVLDILPDEATSGKPLFIRSAPGGGKTSLLRLFSPSVLLTLLNLRTSEPFKEVFSRLKELNVVDENGVLGVGVYLSCRKTFPVLADLGLPDGRAARLLRALLDSRILMGALKSALTVRRLRYPEDLHRVTVAAVQDDGWLPKLSLPCDGVAARTWAEEVERAVCEVIDALQPSGRADIAGHDQLHSLRILDSGALRVDGEQGAKRWLVMLDDCHKLTQSQRRSLRETVLEQRSTSSIWIAERLEALATDELLSPGALESRDYSHVVSLEDAWRKNSRKFESTVMIISERRTRMASDVVAGSWPVGSFAACLEKGDESIEALAALRSEAETARSRIQKLASTDSRYAEWLRRRLEPDGTPRERLLSLRALEIVIERDRRKPQQTLGFELSEEELVGREDAGVRAAAELFLTKECRIPYYYGPSVVAGLGSFNLEQVLRLAGDLFEESLAAALIKKDPVLSAGRQEKILAKAADIRLADLPRRSNNGRDVLVFVDALGRFCRDETYRPTAPYAPGVTGIAISMSDRERLLASEQESGRPLYRRFAAMLASALAHNVLHAYPDYKVKGGRYLVLYLNRLLCVKYRLPLQFGGFREKSIVEFLAWLDQGYNTAKGDALPL